MAALTDRLPQATQATWSQQSRNNTSTRIVLIALAVIGSSALAVGLVGLLAQTPIARVLGKAGCIASTATGGSLLLIATALGVCRSRKIAKIPVTNTLSNPTTYRDPSPAFELKYRRQEGIDPQPGEFEYQKGADTSYLHILTFDGRYIFFEVRDQLNPFDMQLVIEDGQLVLPTNAYCDRLVIGDFKSGELALKSEAVEKLCAHHDQYKNTSQLMEFYEYNQPPQLILGGKVTLDLKHNSDTDSYSLGDRVIINNEGFVDHLALRDALREVWKEVVITDKVDTLEDARRRFDQQVETPYFAILNNSRDKPAYLVVGFSKLDTHIYSINGDEGNYTIKGIPFLISDGKPANLFRLTELGLADYVNIRNLPTILKDQREVSPETRATDEIDESLSTLRSTHRQYIQVDDAILKPGQFVYNGQYLRVCNPEGKFIVITVHNEPNPFGLNLFIADKALYLPADIYGPCLHIGTLNRENRLTLNPQQIEALRLRQAEYCDVNLSLWLDTSEATGRLVFPGNLSLGPTEMKDGYLILNEEKVVDRLGAFDHTALNQVLEVAWNRVICADKVDSPEAAGQRFISAIDQPSYAIMYDSANNPAYFVLRLLNHHTYVYRIVVDGENFTINNIRFAIRDDKPENFIKLCGFGDAALILDRNGDPIPKIPQTRTQVPINLTDDEDRLTKSFEDSLPNLNVYGVVRLDQVDQNGHQTFLGFRTRQLIPYRATEGDVMIFPVTKDRTVQAHYQTADGSFNFAPTSNLSEDFPVVIDNQLIEAAADEMLRLDNDNRHRQMAEMDFPLKETMIGETLDDIYATVEMEGINSGNSWRLAIVDNAAYHIVVAFNKQIFGYPVPLQTTNSLYQFSLISRSGGKLEIFHGNRLFAQNISESIPSPTLHTWAVLREITKTDVTPTKIGCPIFRDITAAHRILSPGTLGVSQDGKEFYLKTGEGRILMIMAAEVPTIGRIWTHPLNMRLHYVTREGMIELSQVNPLSTINTISEEDLRLTYTGDAGQEPSYTFAIDEAKRTLDLTCNQSTIKISIATERGKPGTVFRYTERESYKYMAFSGETFDLTETSIRTIFNQALIDHPKISDLPPPPLSRIAE